MTSLTAINSDAVAWLENNSIICRAICLKAHRKPMLSRRQPKTRRATNKWLGALAGRFKIAADGQSQVMGLADLSRRRNNAVWNGRPPVFNGTNSPLALNGQGTIHFGWVDAATNGTGLKTRSRPSLIGAAPRSVFAVMRHDADQAMMVSMGDTRPWRVVRGGGRARPVLSARGLV